MIEVEVKAGGVVIGQLNIWRAAGNDDHNNVNIYECHLKWKMGRPGSDRTATIRHRYGDHWPYLVEKALVAMLDSDEMRQ